eukprot:1395633-Rhodomonas_salina.2
MPPQVAARRHQWQHRHHESPRRRHEQQHRHHKWQHRCLNRQRLAPKRHSGQHPDTHLRQGWLLRGAAGARAWDGRARGARGWRLSLSGSG